MNTNKAKKFNQYKITSNIISSVTNIIKGATNSTKPTNSNRQSFILSTSIIPLQQLKRHIIINEAINLINPILRLQKEL
jgi:hypothetical protein